jgi:hypothetical protein
LISSEELSRQLADLADAVPPIAGSPRQLVRRRHQRRRRSRAAAVAVVAVLGTVLAVSLDAGRNTEPVHVTSPAHPSGTTTASSPEVTSASTVSLPPGVLTRSAILARYPAPHPGITVQAKLVTLASLAQADPELTQCQSRGCAASQYVWLILMHGAPGSFAQSLPPGVMLPADAGAWSLFPVNAVTGVGRGDSETGGGSLANTAWDKLSDLDG